MNASQATEISHKPGTRLHLQQRTFFLLSFSSASSPNLRMNLSLSRWLWRGVVWNCAYSGTIRCV